MELIEKITDLTVSELGELLESRGLDKEIVKAFKDAEIDGELFPTLTRVEIGDMLKSLKQKRAAISAWVEITGKTFDDEGQPVARSLPRKRPVPAILESDDEDGENDTTSNMTNSSSCSSNSSAAVFDVDSSKTSTPKAKRSRNTPMPSNSSYQVDWLKSYKLPNRFSCAVEAGLANNFLTPNLINEMVRDVCTSVQNFTRSPNIREREAVAKLIVETYPFLKAPQLSKDAKPWGAFEVKIMNRFKKLQLKKTNHDTERTKEKAASGLNLKPSKQKPWMVVPTDEQSEEEVKGVILAIKQEWKATRKDHGKIKDMMNQTFPKRREMVLIEQQPLKEIVKLFPPVQSMLYIKADFARVMGNPDLTTQMKSSFKDVWSCRMLSYAKKNSKHEKVFLEMTAAIDSGCQEEECKERSALKLASMILRPPNRKGIQSKDHEEAVIKVIQDHQSLDEAIKGLRQPVIIIANDIYNSDLMYVAAEGMLFSTITTNKIADAIVILLATYYLFNLDYVVGKNIFCFLEKTLMGVTDDKSPVSVDTLIGILSNLDVN